MARNLEFRGLADRLADAERDRSLAVVLTHLAAIATGAPAHEARSTDRTGAQAARARQIAVYLASIALGWPCERVSLAFGRARSTVSHACRRIEEFREDARFDARLDAFEAWLRDMAPLLEGERL